MVRIVSPRVVEIIALSLFKPNMISTCEFANRLGRFGTVVLLTTTGFVRFLFFVVWFYGIYQEKKTHHIFFGKTKGGSPNCSIPTKVKF